ncbi:site-specific DNA-methyltransferase [Escherichia coli]|nr:site-specific DNA-methyltransferase [Escherichia coli]
MRELNSVLRGFPLFWNGDELQRSFVIDAINRKQPELIKALVANEKIKSVYGTEIDGVLIFEFERLCSLLKYKEYWANSYTRYRNKVGLTSEGKYLDYNSDVVLDFPFKDCVLEGGMTKEEQGKDEIYYNEIIARDEIDRLFSTKVFTNVKRYTNDGVEENIASFEGDNLIIKGNNLIALHSLKVRYAGKVKLIYIDPPYNTGSDSFQYNDTFNHSTWLTFMKNRLEIARELLSNNGVIFVQCDDNEQAYLKVLMDSCFGKQNFIDTFVWKNTDNAPTLAVKSRKNIEFIHCYEKSKNNDKYIGRDSDNDDAPLLNKGNPFQRLIFKQGIIKFNIPDGVYEKGEYDRVELLNDMIVDNGRNANDVEIKGEFKWAQSTLNKEVGNGTFFLIKTKKMSIRYQRSNSSVIAPEKFIDSDYLSKALGISTNEDSKKEIDKLNLIFPSYPKPESLIAFLIRAVTSTNDLVLDFHLGSGTTAAVAHKMGRRYIGIEQMNYINDITVPRLQKVIAGEQGGISKDVGWQGGGSFVYAELMEMNSYFVHEIQKAQSTEELEKLFVVMKTEAHLNYQVALENVLSAEYEVDGIFRKVAFCELELHEQKKLLIEILDKNQLYVNASDMDDSDLSISDSDKAFTRSFYGKE